MADRFTGSPLPKDGPGPPKARRGEHHPQEESASKAYQSQNRYHRHKMPNTPKTPQNRASEEERDLWRLGQAMSFEPEGSAPNRGFTNSSHHPQLHAPGEDFNTMGAGASYDARQQNRNVANTQQDPSWAAHSQVQDGTLDQGETGMEMNHARSVPYPSSSFGQGPGYLDDFSISPSHSIVEQKEPHSHDNTKGANYDHPPSILKGSQSGKLSHHSRNRQNVQLNMHGANPFVVGQQASSLPRSRTNLGSPSPFIHEQQPSGFTPPFSGVPTQRNAAQRPQLSSLFATPNNVMGAQHDGSPNFHNYQGGISQGGSQYGGCSAATGPSDTTRGYLNEAGNESGYQSHPTNFSGDQLGKHHARATNQAGGYPRFGANKFANLQDVVDNDDRGSPASSHHSTVSGYKPAHMRHGHGLRSDQGEASGSGNIPDSSTPRYPEEHRQRSRAKQPRDYSGMVTSAQNPLEQRHGGKESAVMQSSEHEYRRQQRRSKSARGFYSPTPYGERPLPPLPQKTRRNQENARLGLVVKEAQEELELEEELRDRDFDERGEYVKGIRKLELKKSKSTNFAHRSGSPTNYQPQSFTPNASTPRMASTPRVPPQVPRPQPARPTTALNHLINNASVGSGSDCLAHISEVAMSTEKTIGEFMSQNLIERFVKSFSKTNERIILTGLKDVDSSIDWLGDCLWKGSEDARKLFTHQHNETIVTINARVSIHRHYKSPTNDY
jgi:hypothetical protein